MTEHQCANHSGHEAQLKSLIDAQMDVNSSIKMIVQNQHDIREKLAIAESSSKTAHQRIDSMEKLTESIFALAGELKEVSKDTKAILLRLESHDKILEKQDQRIETLEDAPGVIAIKSWVFVGGAVGLATISFFLGKVGL